MRLELSTFDERGKGITYQLMCQPRKGDQPEDYRAAGEMMLIPMVVTHALDAHVMTVDEDVFL